MSDYRGIDLSIEFQSMFDAIMEVENPDTRKELLINLSSIQEEVEAKSKIIREVIACLKSL